jgi:hypothetical protein
MRSCPLLPGLGTFETASQIHGSVANWLIFSVSFLLTMVVYGYGMQFVYSSAVLNLFAHYCIYCVCFLKHDVTVC